MVLLAVYITILVVSTQHGRDMHTLYRTCQHIMFHRDRLQLRCRHGNSIVITQLYDTKILQGAKSHPNHKMLTHLKQNFETCSKQEFMFLREMLFIQNFSYYKLLMKALSDYFNCFIVPVYYIKCIKQHTAVSWHNKLSNKKLKYLSSI